MDKDQKIELLENEVKEQRKKMEEMNSYIVVLKGENDYLRKVIIRIKNFVNQLTAK